MVKRASTTFVIAACLATCVAALVGASLADGPCHAEFDDAVTRLEAGGKVVEGVDPVVLSATALARVAFDALEPAYPAFRRAGDWLDPDALWLDARGWLPATWREDRFDPAAWSDLLGRAAIPYGATPPVPSATGGARSLAALAHDAQEALSAGAAVVRPLAVVARSTDGSGGSDEASDGGRDGAAGVTFTAVIWNWTPYPRLLLFGPRDTELREASDDALRPLLATLGTCAWQPHAWVSGRDDDVARFYVASSQTTVRIVATGVGPAELTFDADTAISAFTLSAPGLEGAEVASAVFGGPGPGLARTIATVTSLRSNVALFGFGRYLEIP